MFQIKQDDHFSSRLLSKGKNSKAESSFRVLYYGKSCGSVPFTWETAPGTPKHPLSHSSLPPLTPPPSFQVKSTPKTKLNQKGGLKKTNFLLTLFHSKSSTKSHVSPSHSTPSISSSSGSSSSYLSASVPTNKSIHWRGWLSRSTSTGRCGINGHDHAEAAGSPTPTSCLGGGYGYFRQFSSRRSKVNVKYPL